MTDRIILRTGEALVIGGPPGTAAEPEVVIGALDGPVGTAMATLMGGQVKGHTRVFALLNTDVQVRPATLMVSKVTVGGEKATKYTNILMGTVQAAIAHGVLDAVQGRRPAEEPGQRPRDHLRRLVGAQHRRRRRSRPPGAVRHSSTRHGQGDRQGDASRAVDRLAAREPGQSRPPVLPDGAGGEDLAGGDAPPLPREGRAASAVLPGTGRRLPSLAKKPPPITG